MSHEFDKGYWEEHWRDGRAGRTGVADDSPPNPYLAGELADLAPGTALDAGCGRGAEARWLAAHGWQVTAVDISSEVLARAAATDPSGRIRWVEADLGTWTPDAPYDLVTTHYAHPAIPQLDFYDRVASWVAPGGTLLIVGHRQTDGDHGHGHGPGDGHGHGHGHGRDHQPPAEASATAATITARLAGSQWRIDTADERDRTVAKGDGDSVTLHDVVVRATRLG